MPVDGNDSFKQRLRSIEASQKIAQQYLDRTAHQYPEHLTLPMGQWRETGGTGLSLVQSGRRQDLAVPGTAGIALRSRRPKQTARTPEVSE